jgi:hypothetical protein
VRYEGRASAPQIEAIRQEAYNEGYAAAMRAVAEFSTSGTAKPTTAKATAAKAAVAKSTSAKATTATKGASQRQTRAVAKPAVRHTVAGTTRGTLPRR